MEEGGEGPAHAGSARCEDELLVLIRENERGARSQKSCRKGRRS
jgi:hypothetical protein